MPRPSTLRLFLSAALAAGLAACSGGGEAGNDAPAASAAPPVIDERQDNFEAIGAGFKAVRGELERGTPDYALIAARANDIAARAGRIADHFPAGTSVDDGHDTEALPAIWTQPEEFRAAAAKLAGEGAKLAQLAPGADKAALAAQAKAVGAACKACHDRFRLDDEKN